MSPGGAAYGFPPGGLGCASHQPHEPVDHEGGGDLAEAVAPLSVVSYVHIVYWVMVLDELDF